jgi:hypothetical protein
MSNQSCARHLAGARPLLMMNAIDSMIKSSFDLLLVEKKEERR